MGKIKIKEIKYRGFVGQYEYLPLEDHYFGKIIKIKETVNFKGYTTIQVKQAFIVAVNDYIKANQLIHIAS